MNHYRHHLGDYAKDTMHLSPLEHGVYRLLIDAYYATEKPLPADVDACCRIARAVTRPERETVVKVLSGFFMASTDGWRHKRIDAEIDAYHAKAETNRETGRLGGRPRKDNPRVNPEITQTVSESKANENPERTLASSHKPVTKTLTSSATVFETPCDSAGALGAAALQKLKTNPPTLAESKIDSHDGTAAGILSAICTANGVRPATPFHPLVVEWAREGISVDKLKHAIGVARQRKPAPQPISPAYLDPILHDESKPAAQVQAEKASESAAKAVDKTQRLLAEQRKAMRSPMPEHLRPKAT